MSVEMIDAIRRTEEKAAELRRKAQADAKARLADAAEQASRESEEAEKKAYREANALLDDAKESCRVLTETQNQSFYERSAKLRASAEAGLGEAADYILKELFAL
ncbi:MAG: hypothetical protein ACI4RV_09610 [Eubacteriales bacterium]